MYSAEKPYVLSIAGLDPTGGAGLLADVKTFEQCGVFGFGVCTAITAQTEEECLHVQWLSEKEIILQLTPLFENYPISVVKLGIFPSAKMLETVLRWIRNKNEKVFIIWDPVLKATSGFEMLNIVENDFYHLLSLIDLITPNADELRKFSLNNELKGTAEQLKVYTSVLLKGGHSDEENCIDYLFTPKGTFTFTKERLQGYSKHGSGCVLSSAIAAYVALEYTLPDACRKASEYMSNFLLSSTTKLGLHL